MIEIQGAYNTVICYCDTADASAHGLQGPRRDPQPDRSHGGGHQADSAGLSFQSRHRKPFGEHQNGALRFFHHIKECSQLFLPGKLPPAVVRYNHRKGKQTPV